MDYNYTPQLLTIISAFLVVLTVIVYERWAAELRAERDRALDHAEEAQELLDALLGVEHEEAAQRHPSNIRVLRSAP